MDFKALKWLLLFAVVIVQSGCATTKKTYDDTTPDWQPNTSQEDDSHGWGANFQGSPH